jgi:hypothetical protein
MVCTKCGHDNTSEAAFCGKCGTVLSRSPSPDPTQRDATKVYPSNPPKSPHLAWLNLLIPGLSQILMEQTIKGIVLLVSSVVLYVTGVGILIQIASIVDGYMIGAALKSGRPVGQWEFFPT